MWWYTACYMTVLIIFTAKYLITVSVGLTLAYGLLMRRKRAFWSYALAVLVVSYALALLAGQFYSHPQPYIELEVTPLIERAVDNAFPSHHVLLAAALAASVMPFHVPLASILWLFALLIGVARVLALLHYPLDIAASFVIVIVAAILIWRTLSPRHSQA